MRLIKLAHGNGIPIWVNPEKVIDLIEDNSDTFIMLDGLTSFTVQGPPDEVAAKLMGDSLAQEPECWVPKKGEKYWAIYRSNNIVRNVWGGDAIDRERLIQKRAFPHTDDGRLDAQKRVLELLEGK